jgi:hypothetical protein
MNSDQRRAYHRQKQREYNERKAALLGRSIKHHNPESHPSMMTHEERLAYNRESAKRCKERQKMNRNESGF